MIVWRAGAEAALLCAGLHEEGFSDRPERAWRTDECFALLAAPGALAFIASADGPSGVLLAQQAGGAAEVLTLAVRPGARRIGVARALIEACVDWAREEGAEALFLEVAVDNEAARALYRATGFVQIGARKGYFAREAGATDALVLRRDLVPERTPV